MIEKKVTDQIDWLTDPFGVKVLIIGTKEIRIPVSMQKSMATIAESEKEKEAKIIDAEGDKEAAIGFREAADEISKNVLALQLKYLETLKEVAKECNSTLVVSNNI